MSCCQFSPPGQCLPSASTQVGLVPRQRFAESGHAKIVSGQLVEQHHRPWWWSIAMGQISWRLDFVPWDEDVYFRWCCNNRCTWQTYAKINLHGISCKIQPARFDDFWTCRCYRQHQAGTDGHCELIFKCFAAETRHHTTRSLAAVQGQWELPLGMNVVNSELVEVRTRKRRVVL